MSRSFRTECRNAGRFSKRLNEIVGATTLDEASPSTSTSSIAANSSFDFSFDDMSQDCSTPVSCRPRDAPQPKRVIDRSEETEEVPVLHKKRKHGTVAKSPEKMVIEEIKGAYLGSTRIRTSNLRLAPQLLREVREQFVAELVEEMVSFTGHIYQPLCVVIDTLEDDEFRESDANGYHYVVIGGCHNFVATKTLMERFPDEEVYHSRLCTVYKKNLSAEASLWLANSHNHIGSFRHSMKLKDKLQVCRSLRDSTTNWQETYAMVLGQGNSKAMVTMICKLANLEDGTYDVLQKMMSLHQDGRLHGQKLSKKDLAFGPDLEPYVFKALTGLPSGDAQQLIGQVIEGEITLAEFKKESKLLLKIHRTQQMFLDLLGIKKWSEAKRLFPEETTREVLEQFAVLPLKTIPQELKDFCKRLKTLQDGGKTIETDSFKGASGCEGIFLCTPEDSSQCDWEQLMAKCPSFEGASLIVLNKPKNWSVDKVKVFANKVTSVNLNHGLTMFTLAVLCSPSEVSSLVTAVTDTRHFDNVEKCFYHIPNLKSDSGNGLTNSVFGLALAVKGGRHLHWADGSTNNLIVCEQEPLFCHDGNVVDHDQKPISLYRQLIQALTSPGQWVMDAFCGTGTGLIASLLCGRCSISFHNSNEILNLAKVRATKELRRSSRQNGNTGTEKSADRRVAGITEDDTEEETDRKSVV